jgi:hypothetical protein
VAGLLNKDLQTAAQELENQSFPKEKIPLSKWLRF